MANLQPQPYYAIRTRRPAEGSSTSSVDSTVRSPTLSSLPKLFCFALLACHCHPRASSFTTNMRPEEVSSTYLSSPLLQYGSGIEYAPPATHDTSRVNFHVKQIDSFAQTLQDVSIVPLPSPPLPSPSVSPSSVNTLSLLDFFVPLFPSPPAEPFPTRDGHHNVTKVSRFFSYTGRRTTCSCCQSLKTLRRLSAKNMASTPTSSPSLLTILTWT